MERQELYCHECGNYVQFDLDLELNGRHVLHCPKCGHEHCRVVKDGVISNERWDSRNPQMQTFNISTTTTTWNATSTFSTYNSTSTCATNIGSNFTYGSWINSSNIVSTR